MQIPSLAQSMLRNATEDDLHTTSNGQDHDKLKRKRQPRNSACQACASLKMKCIAGVGGRCERCHRMGRECLAPEPKPRKRRARSSSRDDEGHHVPVKHVTTTLGTPTTHSHLNRRLRLYSPFDEDVAQSVNHQHHRDPPVAPTHVRREAIPRVYEHDSITSQLLAGLGIASPQDARDMLHSITYSFIVNAFAIFRQLSRHFPFIDLPSSADVLSIVNRRPLFALAICIVTSAPGSDLHEYLSDLFRQTLSTRLLLRDENEIDTLTGLMVYLAWSHRTTAQPYIYHMLYSLAGIATRLGLYKPTKPAGDLSSTLELERAFVGSYYLSSHLSHIGFARPNPIRWSDHLRQYAENVAALGTLPSDRMLVSTLELCHVLDDLEETLAQNTLNVPARHSTRYGTALHIKTAQQRLKALQREHPTLTASINHSATCIHLHHRLIQHSSDIPHTRTIAAILGIKDFVDDLLARPPAFLHQYSIIDWMMLQDVLLVMGRIMQQMNYPSTNHSRAFDAASHSDEILQMLQPDSLLSSLEAHMHVAPQDDALVPRQEGMVHWFKGFCVGLRKALAGTITIDAPGQGALSLLESPSWKWLDIAT